MGGGVGGLGAGVPAREGLLRRRWARGRSSAPSISILIAPLAATIVEQRFPEGDQFVFVRSDGRAIQAEFVDPDLDETPARPTDFVGERPALTEMILAPQGSDAELHALEAELAALDEAIASEEWETLKAELSAPMLEASFWSKPERYATLSRLALMDRVRAAAETARLFKDAPR